MRLIDADAFKAYIRNAYEQLKHRYPDGGKWAKEVTEDFCKDIDEQPTIEQTSKCVANVHIDTEELIERIKEDYILPFQWIPVTERLPSDHERYLLTEEVHYTTGRIIRRVLMAFYDDENDEWYEEMGEDVEVVSYPLAWMPLPEPWKGEEE